MRRVALALALLGCSVLCAQKQGGGGGSGNATSLQGKPVATTAPSSGNCLVFTTSWGPGSCSGTASTNWSALVSGTNTTGAFLIGTGASLGATGSGTITATAVPASGLGAGTIGNNTTGNAATATACATTTGCSPVASVFGRTGAVALTAADVGGVSASTPASHQFLTSFSSGGAFSQAQPAFSDLSGAAILGQLPALPFVCNAGLGDGLNAIPAGTYLQSTCYNGTGQTVTITGIKCFSDNAGTSTMNVSNGAGTGLLTGAVTCTSSFASGTQSGTTTVANGDYFKFTFVADGASKQTTWVIIGTY